MTGTANTLTEYSKPVEQQQRLINLLSGLIFGKNDKIYNDCSLVDISECGGALLIPKNMLIPHNIFDLLIHAPEDTDLTSTVIRAELRWSDIDYSKTHIKIGFRFENRSTSKQYAIKNLKNFVSGEIAKGVDCSLIF